MSFFTKTQKFNGCDLKTLKVEYCMNEDEAFIYLNNFYINPEEDLSCKRWKSRRKYENSKEKWKRKLFAQ